MTDTTTLIQRLRLMSPDLIGGEAADALEQQAAPSVAPEPVAWMWRNKITGAKGVYFEYPEWFFNIAAKDEYEWTQLFAHPPREASVAPEPVAWIPADGGSTFVTTNERAASPDYLEHYTVPLYLAAHPPRAPLTDGELWSWTRSVMSHAACIQQDYAAGKFAGYEQYSAHLDAAAATRADELEARISAHGIGGK